MDELAESIEADFRVSEENVNSVDAPHPKFSSLYKSGKRVVDQNERRLKQLESQKQSRFDYLSYVRNLVDEEDFEDSSTSRQKLKHWTNRYRNQVMLSEWMLEVPENLENDWVVLPCPFGKRYLVVATRGYTHAYAKSGHCRLAFYSALPGGSKYGKSYTILDTIFHEVTRTFYVLDMMCWNSHPIVDSEAEFRFFWKQSQLAELQQVQKITKKNPYRFLPVPSFPCTPETLGQLVSNPTDDLGFELDGLLFYYKHVPYLTGVTPMALWLKPYMLPDIMGIQVPQTVLDAAPASYKGFDDHKSNVKKKQDTLQERLDKLAQHNRSTADKNYGAVASLGVNWTRNKNDNITFSTTANDVTTGDSPTNVSTDAHLAEDVQVVEKKIEETNNDVHVHADSGAIDKEMTVADDTLANVTTDVQLTAENFENGKGT